MVSQDTGNNFCSISLQVFKEKADKSNLGVHLCPCAVEAGVLTSSSRFQKRCWIQHRAMLLTWWRHLWQHVFRLNTSRWWAALSSNILLISQHLWIDDVKTFTCNYSLLKIYKIYNNQAGLKWVLQSVFLKPKCLCIGKQVGRRLHYRPERE